MEAGELVNLFACASLFERCGLMILVNLEGGTVLETALAIVLRLLDFVS